MRSVASDPLDVQGHDEIVWAVEIHNQQLFSASADKTIRVWDIASKRCERVSTSCTLKRVNRRVECSICYARPCPVQVRLPHQACIIQAPGHEHLSH